MNYFYPVIAAFLWGSNTIITKLCANVLSPVEIGFYRWLVAALILTPVVIKSIIIDYHVLKSCLPKLCVLGFLGGVVFQCLAYYAAHYTTATNMGIIQSLMPIMALILSVAFLNSAVSVGGILGVVVSAVGVVVVVSRGDFIVFVEHGINRGDLLMLVATLAFSFYGFYVHKWRLNVPLLQSVYIQAVVATIVLLPLFVVTPKNQISAESSFYIAFAGVAASIFAPLLWMHGISKIGAARASLFFNLVPVTTALLAVALLDEKMTVSVLVGGGLSILGVLIAEVFRPKSA
ncbi:DMT family transporter [Pseudomonas palmensis]|uniref:DMT family transporter n=1 Tax=Pseudomonas palmensis TaxID=2815362 RepID=UPI001AE2E35B|nr:DMT family transporter [Pseudomonas palmensis]